MGTVYEFSLVSGQEYVFKVHREQTGTPDQPTISESFVSAANNDQTYSLTPPPSSLRAAGDLLFAAETTASTPADQSLLDIWDRAETDSFSKGIAARVKALMNDKNKQPLGSGFIYMTDSCVDSLAEALRPQPQVESFCSYVRDKNPATPGVDEIFLTNFEAGKRKDNKSPSNNTAADGLFLAGTRVLTEVNRKITRPQ